MKYQLIYTVGNQQQVDAGAERWKTIQSILELVKRHGQEKFQTVLVKKYVIDHLNEKVLFHNFVLQSHHPYLVLCENYSQ